jgi:hypothetical protein
MPYFLHALTLITTDEGERLAVVELVLTTLALGTIYYARLRGRELGLSIARGAEPSCPPAGGQGMCETDASQRMASGGIAPKWLAYLFD